LVTQATVPHSCDVLAARAAYDSALLCSFSSFRYGKRRGKRRKDKEGESEKKKEGKRKKKEEKEKVK
jgi:hypothetical protein